MTLNTASPLSAARTWASTTRRRLVSGATSFWKAERPLEAANSFRFTRFRRCLFVCLFTRLRLRLGGGVSGSVDVKEIGEQEEQATGEKAG